MMSLAPGFRNWFRGRRLPSASLLIVLAVAGIHLVPQGPECFDFHRLSIARGEFFRLITCHGTHFPLDHLLWDLSAFLVLGAACEQWGRKRFLAGLLLSAGAA